MSCTVVRERYTPVVFGVNETKTLTSNAVGGFLCATNGAITLAAAAQDGKPSFTILSAYPVVAGVYYPLPFYLSSNGGTFTTSGGASGVLGV